MNPVFIFLIGFATPFVIALACIGVARFVNLAWDSSWEFDYPDIPDPLSGNPFDIGVVRVSRGWPYFVAKRIADRRAAKLRRSHSGLDEQKYLDLVATSSQPAGNLSETYASEPVAPPAGEGSDAKTDVDAFLREVAAEVDRARAKFPSPNLNGLALAEEAGEVVKALLDEPVANVRAESVQLAAMAVRVALEGDSSTIRFRTSKDLDVW